MQRSFRRRRNYRRARESDYDGWEARLVDLSRDRNFSKRPSRARAGLQAGGHAPARDRRLRRAQAAARSVPHGRRRRPRRGAAAGAARRDRRLRAAEGAVRRARLPRPAAQGARPGARQRRRAPRVPARFTHIFVDEFQDTDPLQAEILLLLGAADPEQDDWRRGRPRPRPPVHRRRSEAVDLPLPPRRRRHLPRRLRAAGRGRRDARSR